MSGGLVAEAVGTGSETLVRAEAVGLTYGRGPAATVAVQPATFTVRAEDRIALVGPSGSGKSSLLHLIAGLESPTVGSIEWPAIGTRDELRPGPVAIVFQGPSLLPPLTVLENVALPALLAGHTPQRATARAEHVLGQLELDDLQDKLPEQISGGQAQRVAIARALSLPPRLLLADEPTGQLDGATAAMVIDALIAAAADARAAVVVATHDTAVESHLRTRWDMENGLLGVPVLDPA